MPLTPTERSMRSRIASYEGWARTPDRTARTAPGRRAQMARFEAQVDPDGVLTPEARALAADAAMKAFYARMAFASAKARRERSATKRRPATSGEAGSAT